MDVEIDFLAEGCIAGQQLLLLVSRGNAIIAELLRLANHVPRAFLDTSKNNKYKDLIFDFRYFKTAELVEHNIEADQKLVELDEEFRDSHHEILKRFYLLFESVYKYAADFTRYLEELDEGVFIQLTLEMVLANTDGKQLMAEALYLYGTMLLLADEHIYGPLREKLLVSYMRYRGHTDHPLADDVCRLFRNTGYVPDRYLKQVPLPSAAAANTAAHGGSTKSQKKKSSRSGSGSGGQKDPAEAKREAEAAELAAVVRGRPAGYPERYFARFEIPHQVVEMVVGRLRSDDVYNQVSAYPLPEHRSTALATQACMLYVLLYFVPELLNKRAAVMREIVDKHFPDNWVISYYMGNSVDLSLVWQPYPAARAAIANTIETSNVRYVYERVWKRVPHLLERLDQLLTEGVLTKDYVLEKNHRLLAVVRDCNVTIRWLMMHSDLRNPRVLRVLRLHEKENQQKKKKLEGSASAAGKGREEGGRRGRSSSSNLRKPRSDSLGKNKKEGHQQRAGKPSIADIGSKKLGGPEVRGNYNVLMLLLKTAQFEYQLKMIYQELLDEKHTQWEEAQKQSVERMAELAEYFGGERMLTRVKKNQNLQAWFTEIGEKIQGLDYTDSTLAGRKIHQLVQALEEVEEFHQIESSLQVKAFLGDTRQYLIQMMRVVNIKEHYLIMMSLIGDLSYAWVTVNRFTPLLHDLIKDKPSVILMLRSTFLKFASILDLACVRILEAKSPDLFSVGEFYSGQVVAYVRRVLEIIPRSMFRILAQIIRVQTSKLQELPTKVDKDSLRAHAQLDVRYELAKLTNQVSVFTEGILAMETTLVGVIQVNPRQLLEDGIRKELVSTIARAMDRTLIFNNVESQQGDKGGNANGKEKRRGETKSSSKDKKKAGGKPVRSMAVFEQKLRQLSIYLGGLRRSFQYIQDYVSIYGLKIWQEEVSRIINLNVEQECNSFLKKKVLESQSHYQSEAIPVPLFPPQPGDKCVNFVGRLADEMLYHTDCNRTIYVDQMASWYSRNGTELVGIRTFTLLMKAIGAFGVAGLDRLFCFKTVKGLQRCITSIRHSLNPPKPLHKLKEAAAKQYELVAKSAAEVRAFLHLFGRNLTPCTAIPRDPMKLYALALSRLGPILQLFLKPVMLIGQMQLVRRQIAFLMNFTIKMDSNLLSNSLEVLNASLVADVQAHYLNPDSKPYPDDDNPLLAELSKYLENAGISDPLTKIYVTAEPIDHFPSLAFLFVLRYLPRFVYNKQLCTLVTRSGVPPLDWAAFVVGVITLMKQFHSMHTQKFLALLGQYVRSVLQENASLRNGKSGKKNEDASSAKKDPRVEESVLPAEAVPVLYFLEDFCKFSGIERKVVEAFLPRFIFDHIQLA